jgi:hypothetical protein
MHLTSETRLEVTKQTSLAEEKFAKNGVQKNVHVVVKNTGFSVTLALAPSHIPELDFRRLSIDSTLLYDSDEEKAVDFVRLKPIEFKARPNETGDECTVELRIKVLTSQLEDMFFRIRFRALDSLTKAYIPHLVTYSEPIKVISKPDQIKKKPHKTKKRNISEMVVDSLQRIEDSQNEHYRMLSQLHNKLQRTSTEISTQIAARPHPSSSHHHLQPDDFEHAFSGFMTAFNGLPADERPTKIRKLIRSTSSREIDQLTEMLDMFWAEGLQKQLRIQQQQQSDAEMAAGAARAVCDLDECPHKKELARIDEFYKEFLSTSYLAAEAVEN